MDKTFAQRLVNARKIRCMSQRALSDSVGGKVSPTAIAKYEQGAMMPSSNVLIALSNALGLKLDYFFRPFTVEIDPSKFEFRKKSSMGKKEVESIKFLVCSEIEKYLEIETLLGITSMPGLDFSDTVVSGEDGAKAMALQLRDRLNVGSDAIVSAIDLLESVGVKIIEIGHDGAFSGTCNMAGGFPVVVVNRNMTSERKRLTIFHELGHLLMRCADGVDKERMCNVFANEMLIPSDRFLDLIGGERDEISLVELQAAQREYGISVDALMMKARQLGVISGYRYVSFQKRKNALPSFKAAVERSLYPVECTCRFERLVYRALASEVITFSKAASLLGKSVCEVRDTLSLM